jgi:hypothetical protein
MSLQTGSNTMNPSDDTMGAPAPITLEIGLLPGIPGSPTLTVWGLVMDQHPATQPPSPTDSSSFAGIAQFAQAISPQYLHVPTSRVVGVLQPAGPEPGLSGTLTAVGFDPTSSPTRPLQNLSLNVVFSADGGGEGMADYRLLLDGEWRDFKDQPVRITRS